MHTLRTREGSYSCSCVLNSIVILHVIILVGVDNNTAYLTWNFVHTMPREWLAAVWLAILIWHLLLHLVVILATMVWLGATLRKQVSTGSGLTIRPWWMSSTIVVFTDVQHSLWLLMDHEFVVLSIEVVWVLRAIALTDWWDVAIWWLWADSSSCVVLSTLAIICVVGSWFVCLVPHHLLLVMILMDIIIHILLLRNFIILCCIRSKLLSPRNATDWPANRVALVLTGPLTIIAFFFNNKLALLSTTWDFLLNLNLILHATMAMILVLWIVKLSKFLFRLIWCQLWVSITLR